MSWASLLDRDSSAVPRDPVNRGATQDSALSFAQQLPGGIQANLVYVVQQVHKRLDRCASMVVRVDREVPVEVPIPVH